MGGKNQTNSGKTLLQLYTVMLKTKELHTNIIFQLEKLFLTGVVVSILKLLDVQYRVAPKSKYTVANENQVPHFQRKVIYKGQARMNPVVSIQRQRCARGYTKTYFLALPAKRALTSQQQQAHLVPKLWFLYTFLQLKGLGLLEKMADFSSGATKFKMSSFKGFPKAKSAII